MKLGFFSDAHGNVSAAEHCLKLLAQMGAQQSYFLGDAIGYLPGGRDVLRLLSKHNIPSVLGSHEAMAIRLLPLPKEKDEIYKIKTFLQDISLLELSHHIADWSIKLELELPGRKILLVHGRPAMPLTGYLYPDDEIKEKEIEGYDAVFMGHTHRPFIKTVGKTLIVNVGSCGLPRDIGNRPSFVTYDSETNTAEIHQFDMDTERLVQPFAPGTVHETVIACLNRRKGDK